MEFIFNWRKFFEPAPKTYLDTLSSTASALNEQLNLLKNLAVSKLGERFWLPAIIVAAFLFGLVLWLVYQRLRKARLHRKYEAFSKIHKAKQQALITEFREKYPVPPTNSREIASASVEGLVKKARAGEWKVYDIVLTYCHLAADVHDQLNCLTEVLFKDALARAKELDARKMKSGVLFGVPLSVKDSISLKGYPSSVGVFKWKDEVMFEDSRIIGYLVEAGAIPFCKTNVPQTMMSFECRNPLWGTTENPVLKGFSPGGSSGGEAALIGAGGSVLGIGSDIAGSLRIPAHFSGICSLKPSVGRLSSTGSRSFKPTSFLIHPVNGPMAREVGDLVPFFEACLGAPDVDVVPTNERLNLSSRMKEFGSRKLKVGVVTGLPFLKALPPCTRAVEEACSALKSAGHSVVPFEFPFLTTDLVTLVYEALSIDGCHYYKSVLGDEPVDEILKPFFFLMSKSKLALRFFSMIAASYPDQRPRKFLKALGKKDGVAVLDIQARRNEFTQKMNQRWAETGIDFLIMPAFACPANPHGTFASISFAASYTFIWNVLDYVAGVLPVTKVDQEKDLLESPHEEKDHNTSSSKYLLEAELEHLYRPEKMVGLPIGVQIVTPQYQEAQALHAMKLLEDLLAKA